MAASELAEAIANDHDSHDHTHESHNRDLAGGGTDSTPDPKTGDQDPENNTDPPPDTGEVTQLDPNAVDAVFAIVG